MSAITLEAELRTDKGKGASRRLRRIEHKVPAVLYGGDKESKSIHLLHNKVMKVLESESVFSSVFDLKLDGKTERVILKDLQRHPYKPVILHMDFQRVSAKDVLVKMIPLHFINEELSSGVKEGGIVAHTMNQVEVRCQAKDLPEFIEIDLAEMEMDSVLHLTDIKLPKGVQLALDPTEGDHDHPVVSVHEPKIIIEPEETEEELEAEEGAEGEEAAEASTDAEAKPEGEATEQSKDSSGEEKPE